MRRRRGPRPGGSTCRSVLVDHDVRHHTVNTRAPPSPRPCTTHRTATRTRHPPRTAHGRRPAHSNGARAARVEWAPGLAGRAEVGVCDGADIALPSVLQMIYKRISINSAAIPLRATIPRRQSRAEQSRAAIQSSSMANINCFQDASLHINHSPISQYRSFRCQLPPICWGQFVGP